MTEQASVTARNPGRLCAVAVLCVIAGPLIAAVLAAGFSAIAAVAITLAGLVLLFPATLYVFSASSAARTRGQKTLLAVWLVLIGIAALRVASLSAFMFDTDAVAYAMEPAIRDLDNPALGKPFYVRHNCFTSYVVAAELARQDVENIYSGELYRNPVSETVIHEQIDNRVTIDRYQYPPPFLLLPRLLIAVSKDFFQMRTYWFTANVLTFCATVAALAVWMDGRKFGCAWLALPLVLLAPNTLTTLQIGNAHFFIIMLSALALAAFESRRDRVGGIVLGFAIVSKLFPVLLLCFLVLGRRWKAVIWTSIAIAAYCLATLFVFGTSVYNSFIEYQLPRLLSGEAFSFAFEHIRALTNNLSVMGIAYKLNELTMLAGADPASVAKAMTWIYSAILVAALVVSGLSTARSAPADNSHAAERTHRVRLTQIWLALIILAELRSPFLPWGYGSTAVLWFLAVFIPSGSRWLWKTILLGPIWFAFALAVPLPWGPRTGSFDLWFTLIALLLTMAVCLVVVFRAMPKRAHGAHGNDEQLQPNAGPALAAPDGG